MIPVLVNDTLNRRIAEEPRLSAAQRDAIRKAAERDPRAKVLGLDQRMRPVLEARLPGPGQRTRYALLRNGEPGVIAGARLAESWR